MDPDSGKLGAITYDLGSSNVPFSIDSATGVLQTTKEIRYSTFIRDLKQTRTATPTSLRRRYKYFFVILVFLSKSLIWLHFVSIFVEIPLTSVSFPGRKGEH